MARRSRSSGSVLLLSAVLIGGSLVAGSGVTGASKNVRVNNPAGDVAVGDGTHVSQAAPITVILADGTGATMFGDTAGYSGKESGIGYATTTDAGKTWTDRGQITIAGRRVSGSTNLAHDSRRNRFVTIVLACDVAGICDLAGAALPVGGSNFGNRFTFDYEASAAVMPRDATIAVDNTSGSRGFGNIYVAWTHFQMAVPPAVFLSRSVDGGATWTGPVRVSEMADPFAAGPEIAVGSTGTVFVSYGRLATASTTPRSFTMKPIVATSADLGATWTSNATLPLSPQAGELYNCGTPAAPISRHLLPGNFGAEDWPSVAASPAGGDVYLTWTGNPAGDDKAGIYFSRSTNGGGSWSTPVELAKNPRDQFFPVVNVEPGGILGIAFYDRRNDSANRMTDVYSLFSVDRGAHWLAPSRVTSTSFSYGMYFPTFDTVNGNCYAGLDVSLAAPGSGFSAAWLDNRDKGPVGNRSVDPNVYFARALIPTTLTAAVAKTTTKAIVTGKVAPATVRGRVTVTLYGKNAAGTFVKVTAVTRALASAGAYQAIFDRLTAGSCMVTATLAGTAQFAASTKSATFSC